MTTPDPPATNGARRQFVADAVYAAATQGAVASTVGTILLLHEAVGPHYATLVGVLVGLALALAALIVRNAVQSGGRPPGQGGP